MKKQAIGECLVFYFHEIKVLVNNALRYTGGQVYMNVKDG